MIRQVRPAIVVSSTHGLGGNRAETTALVEDLASHGYIVVTIDHIHDAGANLPQCTLMPMSRHKAATS